MFSREWDAFYGLVKTLIWLAVIVVVAVHLGLGGLSHATQSASAAVGTIRAAMTHLSTSIPLP